MPSRLSERLAAVLAEVGRCGLLVDLCADHGRLACEAVARGLARSAVAVELRQAPLVRAKRLLAGDLAAGGHLRDQVWLVRGDGLSALRRAEVVVVAGVGGDLASQLLIAAAAPPIAAGGGALSGASRVVVQPNRHSREVRAWAAAAGFHLRRERAVADGDSLHLVLSFERAAGDDPAYGQRPREAELELGPKLLASDDAIDRSFLRGELHRLRALGPRRPELLPALRALEARFAAE